MASDRARPVLVRADRIRLGSAPGEAWPSTVRAILLRDGRVAAVGDDAIEAARTSGAEVLDLAGLTVTPGLTDSHVHLLEWSLSRRAVDLVRTGSPAEAAHATAEAADRSGSGWVTGRGWNPHRWSEPPHRSYLDRVLPERPVLLQSLDMHSLWANSVALRAAGIDADTADPPGGRIERDPDGSPTGVVRDNAMPLVQNAMPRPTDEDRRSALLDGQAALHRWGVTGVHTVEPDSLALLDQVRAQDRLRLRVLQHLPLARLDDAIRIGLRSGFGDEWLRIGGIKMFLDGALGSLTALLREPYQGLDDRGMATLPADEFRAAVRRGAAAGLAMTVHAIGDAAVDLALDVLGEEGARLEGPVPHRIEHVQLVGADRLGVDGQGPDPVFGQVVCSVQPSHLMTDWPAADRHWGGRARWAYAFRSIEAAGGTLALGSDAPVDPPDPRLGLYAAVTRQDLDGGPGNDGWYGEERLSIARALAGYTAGAARAAGDGRQGRLTPGAFADFIAWDRDPMEVGSKELVELEVMLTVVGGEVVWNGS